MVQCTELIHELIQYMARNNQEDHTVRKLTKVGGGNSYYVTIPIEYVRELGWQEHQKVRVELEGKRIVIEDWEA